MEFGWGSDFGFFRTNGVLNRLGLTFSFASFEFIEAREEATIIGGSDRGRGIFIDF